MNRPFDHGRGSVGLEAASLFCPHCQQAQPVRSKLLLVLPGQEKYAYYCQECGAELGGKVDKVDGPVGYNYGV